MIKEGGVFDMNPMERAGRYIQQVEGHKAFIPNPLPPDPPVTIDDELMMLMSKADRSLGRLDGSTETLPDPDVFVFMYVRKEAVLSSQIEGTQATLLDVLEYEAAAADSGISKDVKEVSNYVDAMNYGLSRLKEFPLSLRLIKEIHARLLEGVRGGEHNPGEFRRSQNWIGPRGCALAGATYVPPPPHEMTKALGDLEIFMHDEGYMPALLKTALIHAQFETIHPFLDGNGRLGRLLITFLLCENQILKQPLLYLSYYFKKNRLEYYDRLQAVRDRGDFEGWVKFFLKGVYEVAQEATTTARGIVALRDAHRKLITEKQKRSTGKSLILLDSLYSRPIITTKLASGIAGVNIQNANNLINKFFELGILNEITGRKRNRVFSYDPYLALFKDPEPPPAPAS